MSPEKIGMRFSNEKWKNSSPENCKRVWNILKKIETGAGMPLPQEMTAEKLLSLRTGELLDYGKNTAADTDLWSKVPEEFEIEGKSVTREKLQSELNEILERSK